MGAPSGFSSFNSESPLTGNLSLGRGRFECCRFQRVSVTRSGEDFPDGEGLVSMFFLIRYQTVVASRRLINFARQLCSRVTLVRMMASSFARHFLQAGVFIICCAAKFPRGIKIIRCQVGVLEEKKIAERLPSSSYASARARECLGSFLGVYDGRGFVERSYFSTFHALDSTTSATRVYL
jgi:hypothetical protein